MNRNPARSVNVCVMVYSAPPGRVGLVKCPACRASMDIHQPNPGQPGKFLGTCEECGGWFRVEAQPEAHRNLVIRLPEVAEVMSSAEGPA